MTIQDLKQLETLLKDFMNDDIFGMGEMEYIEQIKNVLELVDGAIINKEEDESDKGINNNE